ncbi:hypothetical protein Sango_3029600 [Sesamum angolense]|uniref:Uncharacterized protein n=1 Tax=Sesamum angolense TaxID=2727404 RepID=A0AAE1T2Z3_9LAMI|nr:hypothetical protein Sango_3029600 [Sesamum angolense]
MHEQGEPERGFNPLNPKNDHFTSLITSSARMLMAINGSLLCSGLKGYHQIMLNPNDQKRVSFIISGGVYCYVGMPFELKNASETPTDQRINPWSWPLHSLAAMKPTLEELILKFEESWQSHAYEDYILDMARGDCAMGHGHHKLYPVQSEYVVRTVDSKKESVPLSEL